MTCSIDGATPETYAHYRVGGDFERVIENVAQINRFKQLYRSRYPRLIWQFVAFGHNEHEIASARRMAARLGMRFWVKLNWDELYGVPASPVKDRGLIGKESGLGVSDRKEFAQVFGRAYMADSICGMLWNSPQINFDGRMLGCCVNYWSDFGNVFREGLLPVLNNERMTYARRMLLGEVPERNDIACTTCHFYLDMKARRTWLRPYEVAPMTALPTRALRALFSATARIERRWFRRRESAG
jgi:hypothetical protein